MQNPKCQPFLWAFRGRGVFFFFLWIWIGYDVSDSNAFAVYDQYGMHPQYSQFCPDYGAGYPGSLLSKGIDRNAKRSINESNKRSLIVIEDTTSTSDNVEIYNDPPRDTQTSRYHIPTQESGFDLPLPE
ncbi:uncharacterized protein OCT59_028552 [Rhizophagus irregularis]|uniref:uncharacterized protein n=1 Tax=Rhizophagus irregularis TaxID=588596 RepID=UPI00332F250B|nr:hypothetical protein OCT59_028552 [Rhizophagus irregularis]